MSGSRNQGFEHKPGGLYVLPVCDDDDGVVHARVLYRFGLSPKDFRKAYIDWYTEYPECAHRGMHRVAPVGSMITCLPCLAVAAGVKEV